MQNGFSTYSFTVKAGVPQNFKATGTQFRVLEGEGLEITLYAKTESLGTLRQMQVGRGIMGLSEPFTSMTFVSDSDQTVLIAVSFGNVFDDTKANAAETAGSLAELSDVALPDAATTQIAAANSNRSELIVYNSGSADVYLRSDTATAVSALFLQAGASAVISASNTIYAYNNAGVAGSVSVSEVSS